MGGDHFKVGGRIGQQDMFVVTRAVRRLWISVTSQKPLAMVSIDLKDVARLRRLSKHIQVQ